MKRKLRAFAIIIGAGFLIFLILTILLNRLLSEERLKAMLIDPAQKELGRQVTLGSLDVSLLRGITIKDIGIKERDSKQDFISVKTFRLSYELLPLLRKKLVIKEVLIDEPKIRIIRGSDGQFNFADIGQQRKDQQEELMPVDENNELEPLPITMTFDRVNINKAILTLTDKTNVLPEVHSEADLTMSVILGKTLADIKYNGTLNLLANGKYRGHKPVLQVDCAITEKLISYQGHLTVGFDKVQVDGWAANYLSTPDIELNADINSIDLDELASLKQFISDNSDPKQPKSSHPAQQKNQLPAKKETPATLGLSAHGKVNIGAVSSGRIKMQEIALVYQLKDNIITLDEVSALIFGGSINGDLSADISKEQPAFQGKIKGEEIKVSEIMVSLDKPAKAFSGKLAADLSFRGSGKEWSVIQNNLTAEGRFTLIDGGMQRTPITTALAALLDIQELSDLRFKDFSGNFTITDGKVSLDSNLQSRNINILAKGAVGLDGGLNMPLTLQLSPEYSKILDNNSTFTRYLADEEGHTTMHLRAKGSVQKPRLTIDSKGVRKQVTKAIEKKIMEELGRAITKNRPATTIDSGKDQVKDVSEMLLKKLLGN
jgi:uncharacterized protein involved in outer membrane biogenesis